MDEMYSIKPARTYNDEEVFTKRVDMKKTKACPKYSIRLFIMQNQDIVRNIAIVLALVLITNMFTYFSTKSKVKEAMTEIMHEEVSKTAFVTAQDTRKRVMDEYGITDEKLKQNEMDADAKWIAIMLQAYEDAGNSDEALYLIGCSAKNRQLSNKYPNDMYSVVSAYEQYMGFNENRDPTARVNKIAKDIEKIYSTVGAPMSTKYVYINWTSREVKLLDNLEKGVPTHTFYESDMEDFLDEWEKSNG